MRRLQELESENAKLKRLVSKLSLEKLIACGQRFAKTAEKAISHLFQGQ